VQDESRANPDFPVTNICDYSSVAKRDGLETSFDAAEEFAARAVQKAFRDWREARIQLIKGLAWKSTLITND
jgi:hypothetical protein